MQNAEKGENMNSKSKFKLFWTLLLIVIIGLAMTGCATSVPHITPGWDRHQQIFMLDYYIRDYIIHGVVQLEATRIGILRLAIPFTNLEGFVWSTGGITHADLLSTARVIFPGTNAVINVQIDRVDSNFFIFGASRRYIATALAVEFVRYPRP